MGKETIFDKIRHLVGGISWKIFLWSIKMTQERYWKSIYLQEKMFELEQKLKQASVKTIDDCYEQPLSKKVN